MRRWTSACVVGLLSLGATVAAASECEVDRDCSAYKSCSAGQCVSQQCSKDTECPNDGVCSEGVCASPGIDLFTPHVEPETSPPVARVGYVEKQVRGIPALWMSGLVATGLVYVTTIGITAGVCEDECSRAVAYSSIPVVGPLVAMSSDLDTGKYSAALVVSSVFQLTGVVLVVAGLTMKRTELAPVVALGDGPDAPIAVMAPGPVGSKGALGMNLAFLNW